MGQVRKFRITVNGKVYEVEAEEVTGGPVTPPAPEKVAVAPSAPVADPVPAPPPARAVAGGSTAVDAPLPGAVLDVKVVEGQGVEAGQVLVILEAMKMENEITAPRAGTVREVRVTKGATVNAGDVLVVLA